MPEADSYTGPLRRSADHDIAILAAKFEAHVERASDYTQYERKMLEALTKAVEDISAWKHEINGSIRMLKWISAIIPVVISAIWALAMVTLK